MSAPHAPHDQYAALVARVHEARAALDVADQRLREAVGELSAYVKRADAELTDEQRREAEALITVHPEHRRAFHPPPS
jgi:hypothetical protein